MAKKKITKKKLQELHIEGVPQGLYKQAGSTVAGSHWTYTPGDVVSFVPDLTGENKKAAQQQASLLANDMAFAQNEAGGPIPNAIKPNIDLYNGKEALKLVFEKKLDSFKWVNENTYIRGKSGRVRVEVRCGRAEFYVKPLFKDRVCLEQLRLREEVVDLIRMRAGTSKSTNRLLKLLHEL